MPTKPAPKICEEDLLEIITEWQGNRNVQDFSSSPQLLAMPNLNRN
jgi:hypothetical protein